MEEKNEETEKETKQKKNPPALEKFWSQISRTVVLRHNAKGKQTDESSSKWIPAWSWCP